MTHYMTALAKLQVCFVLNRENAHRNAHKRPFLGQTGQLVHSCDIYGWFWNNLDKFIRIESEQITEKTEPQGSAARF
jgi:hypothetical protein